MYNIGQKVIYSDLSPWEVATVVGLKKDIKPEHISFLQSESISPTVEDFDYLLEFDDGVCPVQSDGIREYTPENVQKYLS